MKDSSGLWGSGSESYNLSTVMRGRRARPGAGDSTMRIRYNPRWPAAVAFVATVSILVSCGSGTREVAVEDQGGDGPLPTAPANFSSNGSGENSAFTGTVDINDLIRRIDALTEEDDLCTLLTGQAMSDVTGADINLTSLITNPAGFSQLFTSLDKVFGHMGQIAPPELITPLGTMQSVWATLAGLDLSSSDAETQASELIASPELRAAQDTLGVWVTQNCR